MRTFVSYSLEHRMEPTKGLYNKLHNLGLVLKILTLLSLLLLFLSVWYLFVTAFLFLCDRLVSIWKSKTVFTVTCRMEEGVLTVKKTFLSGKEVLLEEIPVQAIERTEFGEISSQESIRYYSEIQEGKPLRIVGNGRDFTVLSDLYLYAIIEETRKENL